MKLVVIGKIREKYLQEGCVEFLKRLTAFVKLEVIELKDKQNLEQEALAIEKHLSDHFVVILDPTGKQFSSEKFAELITQKTINENKQLCFVIGSSEGLSQSIKQRADLTLSLSKMTLTHEMCRLFFLEQLYRAYMINAGRKYHK